MLFKKKLFSKGLTFLDVISVLLLIITITISFMLDYKLEDINFDNYSTSIGYMTVNTPESSYVIDGGKSRVAKISNSAGEVIYTIDGIGGDKNFYQGENICADEQDDSIYVQSVDWDDSGYLLASERILHYDMDGNYIDTPYERLYVPEDEVNARRIFDISIKDGVLTFIYADRESIELIEISKAGERSLFRITEDNPVAMYQNFAQSDLGEIYGINKKNYIVKFSKDGSETVYESPEGVKEIPYYLCVTHAGDIYYTDIYNSQVKKVISKDSAQIITSCAEITKKEYLPGEGQIYTVETGMYENKEVLLTNADENIVMMDLDGNVIIQKDSIPWNMSKNIKIIIEIIVYILMLISILFGIARILIYVIVHRPHISTIAKTEMIVAFSVLGVTMGVLFYTTGSFKTSHLLNIANNLENLAIVGANSIESDWLDDLDNPKNFLEGDYYKTWESLYNITTKNHDYDNRYGAEIDIIDADGRAYSVCYPDCSIGVYFPLDAGTKEEILQIYETGEANYSMSALNMGGTFIFGRSPIYDKDGNVKAVVGVAQDSYKVNSVFSKLVNDILVTAVLIVIFLMFMINEIFAFRTERNNTLNPDRGVFLKGIKIPVELFRICAFGISFVLNMTSSFLSVYTSSFWNETIGISESLAGAIPLFANGIFVAGAALFVPTINRKFGFKITVITGVLCSCFGDLLAGFSVNYISIVMALLLNGLGFGILLNALSLSLGIIEDEKARNESFAKYNSGCISGINCGMIFGSCLAGIMQYHEIFYVTSVLWALQIILFIALAKYIPKQESVVDKIKKKARIVSFKGIMYTAFAGLPYAIMGSFVYFYIPLFANANGYNENYVSLLMMISAVCGIFLSQLLTVVLWNVLGRLSACVAIVMYAVSWLMLASFSDMKIVAMAMLVLGLTGAFGGNVLIAEFLRIINKTGCDSERALSVYNFAGGFGQAISSVVCGLILGVGMAFGMQVFVAIVICMMLVTFVVTKK